MSEKLQKVLARTGLGSRRHMEQAIIDGRVSVNGVIAKLGDRIEVNTELRLDGRVVQFSVESELRRRVIAYYKPEGEICSRQDPEGRPTVFDQMPRINGERWVMVGRLDINSSGLLLFTNDGEFANRLMHPSSGIEREYAVRVMGVITPEIVKNLTEGVELDDGPAKFESMSELGGEGYNRWWQVVVREGRNREVRRLFESQGLKVSRLLRTRYGTQVLPRVLRTGRWLELDKPDIDSLLGAVELRPRRGGTGLYGLAKRRDEKMRENPLRARVVEDNKSRRTPLADGSVTRAANPDSRPNAQSASPEARYTARPSTDSRPSRPSTRGTTDTRVARAASTRSPGATDARRARSVGTPDARDSRSKRPTDSRDSGASRGTDTRSRTSSADTRPGARTPAPTDSRPGRVQRHTTDKPVAQDDNARKGGFLRQQKRNGRSTTRSDNQEPEL